MIRCREGLLVEWCDEEVEIACGLDQVEIRKICQVVPVAEERMGDYPALCDDPDDFRKSGMRAWLWSLKDDSGSIVKWIEFF